MPYSKARADFNKKQTAERQSRARAQHDRAAAELRSMGITPPEFREVSLRHGPKSYVGAHSGNVLTEGRNKYIKVNQREQLRDQNQEIATKLFERRRRARGRMSLVDTLPRGNTMGASGTIA